MISDELKSFPVVAGLEKAIPSALLGGKYDRREVTLEVAPEGIVDVCLYLKIQQKFVRLSTVTAVALFSVLMGKRGIAYDPKYSDDQIGVFVAAGSDQIGSVEQLLRSAGAVEVRREAA